MVSIITVNYNGLADTCEMIASFRKYETYPYEIIVVDNGSQNPEADEIKTRHPEVKVVQNTNTGFAGGNNAGLKVAEGSYLFFLNNDTIIKDPILETLVHRLEAAPENGGISPMLKYSNAPDTLQYAGFTPFSRITLRNSAIGFNEKDQPCYQTACETASLHGAAMMIRRDVLQRVGPMTEIYFLFYELLSPFIELFGILTMVLSVMMDMLNVKFMLVFLACYALYGILLTLTAYFSRIYTIEI